MKRDLNRIREILLECEASKKTSFELRQFETEFDQYQIRCMNEAGLVVIHDPLEGQTTYRPGGFLGGARFLKPITFRITWAGHDYIETVRDVGIWNKTKDAVSETGGNATLEIVSALAKGFLKKKIAQHTGIEI